MLSIGMVLAAALATPAAVASSEIPAFARRYRVSCSQCHMVVPKLNDFGNEFAGNGFRFAPNSVGPGVIETGDPELSLLESFPLAARLDAYLQSYSNGSFESDFQTPYNLKVLSGGPISGDLSYYFYFFMSERGEVAGIEDAFVYWNDVAKAPVDLAVGQFQISDPMFKRELRLEFEDYAVYRARLAESAIDLTYDRGLYAIGEAGPVTGSAILVNGNGKPEAGDDRQFDVDPHKNFLGHLTADLPLGVRLGGFGFTGRETANGFANDVWMAGADGTFGWRSLELNLQYLHREDTRPSFVAGGTRVVMDGGFAELLVLPGSSKWYGFALYNYIEANQPVLTVRLGESQPGRRYHTVSLGVGREIRRNFRLSLEGGRNMEDDATRVSLGIMAAF